MTNFPGLHYRTTAPRNGLPFASMVDLHGEAVTDAWLRHNDQVEWDEFEPDAYWCHNYRWLREDDRAIILASGEFFSGHFQDHPEAVGGAGIDIGSGANLYPALAMLPWTSKITLTDHSLANVTWLRQELARAPHPDPAQASWAWQPFWDAYTKFEGYDPDLDAIAALGGQCHVEHKSVFDIALGAYDIGTMFFVAESMTSYENEFEDATEHFLQTMKPGAPFAAAFIDKSLGYVVGDKSYPAVREVDLPLVERTLKSFAAVATVEKVPIPGNDPLRDGYDGMIIAVGTTHSGI